jgi:NADH dehydrogenase
MSSGVETAAHKAKSTDVLVLGGSFAGIEVVHQILRLSDGRPPRITVVDRQERHGYLPLVQERITETIAADRSRLETASYVRSIPGARYVAGEIVGFDADKREVELADGSRLRGRFVVVALGSVAEPPPSIRGAEELVTYKEGTHFDRARAALAELLRSDGEPHVAVIGGGVSGCELAGELALLSRRRPEGWTAPTVTLVTGSDRLLPGHANRIGRKARRVLEAQGVRVRTGARLVEVRRGETEAPYRRTFPGAIDGLTVCEGDGEAVEIPCGLAFWAGGVRPAPILDRLDLPRTEAGWLSVGPTLQCFPTPTPTNPDVFACGDAVRIESGAGEWPTMQRAIECIWQAKRVAKSILLLAAHKRDYPDGVPPLSPHRLRSTFFYGISLGRRSLIVYRGLILDLPGVNHWFRRWLMRQYFARYEPLPGSQPAIEEDAADRDSRETKTEARAD